MAGPSVVAVLVAHASGTWLRDALVSLADQSFRGLKVVVVAVGDAEVPEDVLPARMLSHVVSVPEQAGFARAVNAGIGAGGAPGDLLLVLHDDVVLDRDVVRRLVDRAAAEPDVAAVGAKLVEMDEPAILQEVGGAVDRFGIRRSRLEEREVDHGQYTDPIDVVFASAACLLVRSEALEAAGRFDPEAWPLYEDVDLCWRLRATGGRVVVEPTARVRHAAGLSRGRRAGSGRTLGPVAVRTAAERGRLRFMLKNYEPLTLALIMPQYVIGVFASASTALVRREFWRVRSVVSAWVRVAGEAPRILEGRRALAARSVDDHELLGLASKTAAPARRYERVAVAGRTADALRRLEHRAGTVVRDPVTWAAVAAMVVLVVVLRGVLFGGVVGLGELRPPATFARALSAYLAPMRPGALEPAAAGTPGIVLLGLLRSILRSAALTEKALLVGPLVVAAFGAARLGRLLGLGVRGRRLTAVAAAVNPATVVLVRHGRVGALILWAAAGWFAGALLVPQGASGGRWERVRRSARWVLAWAAVAALHPPAIIWLTALGLVIVAAVRDDSARQRLRLLATGVGGAVVLCLPWSISWFGPGTPLVGAPGLAAGALHGLQAATFSAGWPLVAWTAVALGAMVLVGPSRAAAAVAALLGLTWIAGILPVLPGATALAGAGWCVVFLFAYGARGIRDDFPNYALGYRQAAVVVLGILVAAGWVAGSFGAVAAGTDGRNVAIEPQSEETTGRVLWLLPSGADTVLWTTDGFARDATLWPEPHGGGARLVAEALRSARDGRTHRLGAILALADISHIVSLAPREDDGLAEQVDLAGRQREGGASIYRNGAWTGPAMLFARPPDRPLTAEGLAGIVGTQKPVASASLTSRSARVTVPEGAEGVVYLAGGSGRGWTIGGERARPAAAGVWVRAPAAGGTLPAVPPGGVDGLLRVVQAVLVLGLIAAWATALYLAGPAPTGDAEPAAPATAARPAAALGGVVLVAGAVALGWFAPDVLTGTAAAPALSFAAYCPPIGEGFSEQVALVNPSSSPARYLVRPSLGAPPTASASLGPRERVTFEVQPREGAVVEAFGRRVYAAAITRGEGGASGLSSCVSRPVKVSSFAEGGRSATGDGNIRTGYIIDNPFTELARAQIRLFSADETIAPPRFKDIRIPPGGFELVDPESQLEPQSLLGAEITIWQGRAIVSRRMRRSGLLIFTPGVQPVTSGILPRAATRDASTRLVVVDPSDEPAQVSADLAGAEGSIPPASFDVAAGTRKSFDLGESAPGQPSMFVRVHADPASVIESVVVPSARDGISVLPPLDPRRSWVLPVVEKRIVFVVNPGPGTARLRFTRLGPGAPPARVSIDPGKTYELIAEGDGPFGLLIETTAGEIVTAVAGANPQAGAAPGIPVDN